MIPDKSFVRKVRTPFPSMRPTKRFVAISRDATGLWYSVLSQQQSESHSSAEFNHGRHAKEDLRILVHRIRKLTSFSQGGIRFYALMFYLLKNI